MTPKIKPLGETFGPIRGLVSRPFKARLKNEGINYPFEQLITLKLVTICKDSIVQQDIAEKLGKDKSVILRMIDALVKDGFIKRVVDANDRRRNILEVTEQGGQLINKFHEIEMKLSVDLLEGVTDSDLAAFYRVLDLMKTNSDRL